MMGGGEIIASFVDQGEIDEFRINVIPILIGEGIPLIQPRHSSPFSFRLFLTRSWTRRGRL
jgi:dihydrofolate reductase